MAVSKILTNERFFVIIGGALGFVLCWSIPLWMGQGAEVAFEKAAFGCVMGGGLMFIFARALSAIIGTLKRDRGKQNEEVADKASVPPPPASRSF